MPPPGWGYRLAAALRVYWRREGIGILILPLFYAFLNFLSSGTSAVFCVSVVVSRRVV
jgi:hypothetical protein